MTRIAQIANIIAGSFMVVCSVMLFLRPEISLRLIALILSGTFTLRGIQCLIYYITMARFMVEGKKTLYRGIVLLDVGLLTSAMYNDPLIYIILYIAGLHFFYGLVDLLRAREAKSVRAPSWRTSAGYAAAHFVLTTLVLIGGIGLGSATFGVFGYAVGLINAGVIRIVTAIRRTEIVYIQ